MLLPIHTAAAPVIAPATGRALTVNMATPFDVTAGEHVPDNTQRYLYPFIPITGEVIVKDEVVAPAYTPPLETEAHDEVYSSH